MLLQLSVILQVGRKSTNSHIYGDLLALAARVCLPPFANVLVGAPTPAIRSSIDILIDRSYNDGISVDCEQYAKLGCSYVMQ